MQGNKKKIVKATFIPLAAIILSGCGASTSSESTSVNGIYTVTYYDDNVTDEGTSSPNRVGYSYVATGHGALYPTHLDEGATYKTSKSGRDPSGLGKYWSFSSFAGTYEDGTAVDLKNITGDCSVYAQFTEKSYSWTFNYYNSGRLIKDASGDSISQTLVFDGTTLPDFPPNSKVSSLTSSTTQWFETSSFTGFSFALDTAHTSLDGITIQSGDAAPSGDATKGVVYVSKEKTDKNRTYPLYLGNGSDWVSLGNLKDGVSLRLNAEYDTEARPFTMTLYPTKADFTAKTNAYTTTYHPVYGDSLEVNVGTNSITIKDLKPDTSIRWQATINQADFTGSPTTFGDWAMVYTGTDGLLDADVDPYIGTDVDLSKPIFENCAFYLK